MKAEYEHLGIKIPKVMSERITEAIDHGQYVSKSDLVRAAIRKLLEEA